jgi:hypothetical protein
MAAAGLDYQLIGLIGLFVTIALGGGGVVWRLTRVEINIRASITAETKALEDKIGVLAEKLATAEKQTVIDLDVARRDFGETVSAIRSKVHEVETWARDEFVRKNSFENVIGRMEKSIESMSDKIDKRLERLTEKIDGRP